MVTKKESLKVLMVLLSKGSLFFLSLFFCFFLSSCQKETNLHGTNQVDKALEKNKSENNNFDKKQKSSLGEHFIEKKIRKNSNMRALIQMITTLYCKWYFFAFAEFLTAHTFSVIWSFIGIVCIYSREIDMNFGGSLSEHLYGQTGF